MKSIASSSMLTSNNLMGLIFFVFIFIAFGMFFMIKKTTEKDNESKMGDVNGEQQHADSDEVKIIQERRGEQTANAEDERRHANANANASNSRGAHTGGVSSPIVGSFQDEVGLFIKNDKPSAQAYSHMPTYIPPFGSGKETRCVQRQINKPTEVNNVQYSAQSNLVKGSSDASF
jgi:hypothetical protein